MSEILLITRCQNGCEKAFEELIKRYYPMISSYLLRLTNDKELSKDLTQEVFIKVINNIEKFDFAKKVRISTYFITIAKNLFIDHYRRNSKMVIGECDFNELIDDSESHDELIIKNIFINEIKIVIDNIPKEQKEVIKMKYFENFSLKEMSKILNLPENTLKSRLRLGIKKLNNLLTRGGSDD